MKDEMKQQLQKVLDSVKDPVYHQSIAELGLVERIRFDEAGARFIVFFRASRPDKACCSLINDMVLHSIKKNLADGLKKQFPGLSVEFS